MIKIDKNKINLYLNYLFIAYAFSFPISKAATNLFEALILLLWIIEGDWKYKLKLYLKNPLTLSFILFFIYAFISLLWARDIEFGIKYMEKYRHFLIIFVFLSSLDLKFAPKIISAFLFSVFFSEIVSYGIFFEIWNYKNISPTDPTPFMSHMTYSTILAFTSSILLIKLFLSKDEPLKNKIIYTIFFISVTANLFVNGGRTGQIIYIVLILILIFTHVKHKLKSIFLSLFIISLVFIGAYKFSPNFKDRTLSLYNGLSSIYTKNDYTQSGGARISLWIVGVNAIKDSLPQGTGIGNDAKTITTYAKKLNFDDKFMKIFEDNHNIFITLTLIYGVFGLFFSIYIFYYLARLKFKEDEYKSINTMFVITFIMFSFTHNTFHTMNPMVFFALFAGLLSAISNREVEFGK